MRNLTAELDLQIRYVGTIKPNAWLYQMSSEQTNAPNRLLYRDYKLVGSDCSAITYLYFMVAVP